MMELLSLAGEEIYRVDMGCGVVLLADWREPEPFLLYHGDLFVRKWAHFAPALWCARELANELEVDAGAMGSAEVTKIITPENVSMKHGIIDMSSGDTQARRGRRKQRRQ